MNAAELQIERQNMLYAAGNLPQQIYEHVPTKRFLSIMADLRNTQNRPVNQSYRSQVVRLGGKIWINPVGFGGKPCHF
jgi:hypothetical protein